MIIADAGVFLDPRPKQINRHSDIKESALDYFADTYGEQSLRRQPTRYKNCS